MLFKWRFAGGPIDDGPLIVFFGSYHQKKKKKKNVAKLNPLWQSFLDPRMLWHDIVYSYILLYDCHIAHSNRFYRENRKSCHTLYPVYRHVSGYVKTDFSRIYKHSVSFSNEKAEILMQLIFNKKMPVLKPPII